MGMKEWFARVEPMRVLLKISDMKGLQNHSHFGSTMFRAICAKLLQAKV
jgi:hypothetical protein